MSKKKRSSIGQINRGNKEEQKVEKTEYEIKREKFKEDMKKREEKKQWTILGFTMAGTGIMVCIFWFVVLTFIGMLFA